MRRNWRNPIYRAKQADGVQRSKSKRGSYAAGQYAALIEKCRQAWAQSPHNKLTSEADFQARNAFIRQAAAAGLTLRAIGLICELTAGRVGQIVRAGA